MANNTAPSTALALSPKDRFGAVGLVAALSLGTFLFGGRLQEKNGIGWDGVFYVEILRGFPENFLHGAVSRYYSARVVAPALAKVILDLLNLPTTDKNIVLAFGLLNLVCMIAATALWVRIASREGLSRPVFWIGTTGIFLAFPIARFAQFYPVLTDSVAMLLSIALLAAFLERRVAIMAIVTLIAGFAWSTGALVGAILIATTGLTMPMERLPLPRAMIVLTGFALLAAILSLVALSSGVACPAGVSLAERAGMNHFMMSGVSCGRLQSMMTAACSCIIALLAIASMWSTRLADVRRISRPKWRNLLVGGVAFLLPIIVIHWLTNLTSPPGADLRFLLYTILLAQPGMLLLPIVSLSVYWGPLVLLAVILWPDLTSELRRLGPGMIAVASLGLFLGLGTEPRYLNFIWPFVAFAVIRVLSRRRVDWPFATLFISLALVWSKIWFPLNVARWTGGQYEGLRQWPKQAYFLNFGVWMNWSSFLIQAALLIGSAWFLRRALHNGPQWNDALTARQRKTTANGIGRTSGPPAGTQLLKPDV